MTQTQIAQAKMLIGKMSREDVARQVGTSVVSLKRAFRGTRLAFHNYCSRQPELVRAVNRFYQEHGNARTAEQFGLKPKQIEHIVYRYKMHNPRQIRWTNEQIHEAAKMAGLVSMKAQARYFNRPNANAGAIKSLWTKRFGMGACSVNGMVHDTAKHLVNIKARYLRPIGDSRKNKPVLFRCVILWVDMEKCLKPEVPEFIRSAIHTMADFQRWLWKSDNPKPLILRMIKQRECK